MQTQLAKNFKDTPLGQEADKILRSCVHCGFCNATCPTYQLLGDELDGPRGRIYLIKQMLEGYDAGVNTQLHLDRCLTCRACETTCPSSVQYGRLLDIGRERLESTVTRPTSEQLIRWLMRVVLPYPSRIKTALSISRLVKPFLSKELKNKIPAYQKQKPWPVTHHARRILMIPGCVQSVTHPEIDAATARLLDRCGISIVVAETTSCCGAISHHLGAHDDGLKFMRNNIDQWWPYVESGVEAIVMTASACSLMLKDYAYLLRDDSEYTEKAIRISELTRDISEILAREDLSFLKPPSCKQRLAFHAPCTLQHGQKLSNHVENMLESTGFALTKVPDAHLCCGSAGTYSILQADLSKQLRNNKIVSLQSDSPDSIATANIGCLMHLQTGTEKPVRHWIELLDAQMS